MNKQPLLKPLVRALVAAAIISAPPCSVLAQVVTSGVGNTNVYRAPNGVGVVDIATPNAAGVSHNSYLQFNVAPNGLVLNNANSSQMTRQSQLAGQVQANLNLQSEAKVILNQVTGPNRSLLAGYMEVLGGQADVVVANPYGITCSGCGFINTPRVTLSTGVPQIDPVLGTLTGIRVGQGDILVTGRGLDGASLTYLDLVARSITVDGQINAQALNVALGANLWNYASQTATAEPGTAPPSLGFDSTALGGMYANRIRIVATDAGVGVRMLGDAAATSGDLTINANGRITVRSRLHATQGSVQLAHAGAGSDGANAISIEGANAVLTAAQEIVLSTAAAGAGVALSDASLVAGRDLAIRSAGGIDDRSGAPAAAATRFAQRDVDISAADTFRIDQSSLGAGGRMRVAVGALSVAADGTRIYSGAPAGSGEPSLSVTATAGDLDLGTALVQSPGAMRLTAERGDLRVAAGSNGVRAGDTLRLSAGGALRNAGQLQAVSDVEIRAAERGVNLRVENSGAIQSGQGTLSIAGYDAAGVVDDLVDVVNAASGTLLAGRRLVLAVNSLANSGRLQSEEIGIAASGKVSNGAGASVMASGAQSVAAQDIVNRGVLQANGPLTVAATQGLVNEGAMLTTGEGAALVASGHTLGNSGSIQSAGALRVDAASVANSGTVSTLVDAQGRAGLLGVTTDSLVNEAGGKIMAGGALHASSASATFDVTNRGQIQVGSALSVGEAGHAVKLVNSAAGVVVGDSVTLTADTVDNRGALQAASALAVTASGAIANDGTVLATGPAGDATMASASLANAGRLQAGRHLSVTTVGALAHAAGATMLAVAGDLTVHGDNIGNAGTLAASAGAATIVADTTLTNSGTLQSHGALGVTVGTLLSNTATGAVVSGGTLTFDGNAAPFQLRNDGRVEAAQAMRIGDATHSVDFVNAASVASGHSVTVIASNFNNTNASARILSTFDSVRNANAPTSLAGTPGVAGDVRLTVSGTLSNQGVIHADNDLGMWAFRIANESSAGMSARRDVALATPDSVDNKGAVFAGRDLNVLAGQSFTNLRGGDVATGRDMQFVTRDFKNYWTVNAAGNLRVVADTFLNQADGPLPEIKQREPIEASREGLGESDNFNCSGVRGSYYDCAHNRIHQVNFTELDYLEGSFPTDKAQLLAGADLTLDYSGSASNVASVMAGRNVRLTGPTNFLNRDFQLYNRSFSVRYRARNVDVEDFHVATTAAEYAAINSFANGNDNLDHRGVWIGRADPLKDPRLYQMEGPKTTVQSQDAGVFAVDAIDVRNGLVINAGPRVPVAVNTRRDTTVLSGPVAMLSEMGSALLASVTRTAESASPLPGVNLSLPTNPNGLFVTSRSPSASYLVETNPLFMAGSGFAGSSYLAQRLGLDTDLVTKRLGDANYEARLMREQLIAQTGRNILIGYASEADQMKGLMDKAYGQASGLRLTFGKALTADQVARLQQDVVWMVEQEVSGQKVLVPVVYLSPATLASVQLGTVVAGNDVSIGGAGLQNLGGTIAATNNLSVTVTGDVVNRSGTMTGRNVAITSTDGSIVNATNATFYGDEVSGRTQIGQTGSITATGDLDLSAAKDIRVVGAALKSGGDTLLIAGRDVTLDTIQDKTATSSGGSSSGAFSSSSWSRNEIDTRQIGSTLETGRNLQIKSGHDITVAGSQVNVAGNAAIEASRALNIVDRQDVNQVTTTTRSQSTSVGASGSTVSVNQTSKEETVSTRIGTSVATSINVGGNALLKATDTVTVRGSDVAAQGKLAVAAQDIDILAGQNTFDRTTETKTTVTGLSLGVNLDAVKNMANVVAGKDGSAGAAGKMAADLATVGMGGPVGVDVGISASTTRSKTVEVATTARGSSLTSGGDMSLVAGQSVAFQGAQVGVGGDLAIQATDIKTLEARNTNTVATESHTTGLNIALPTSPSKLMGDLASTTLQTGKAQVTLAEVSDTVKTGEDVRVQGSGTTFKVGGDMTRTASNSIKDQGTQIATGGQFTQSAVTIDMAAATDTTSSVQTEVKNKGTIGASVQFDPVKTVSDAKQGKVGAVLGALGGPTGGVDADYRRDDKGGQSATSTAVVTTIVAGGDIRSTSSGTTRLEGGTLASGGNIDITAKTLVVDAAANTQADANREQHATVGGRAEVGVTGAPSGSLTGGYGKSAADSAASQAVTATISAGQSLTIKTTGDATFEGTALAAGKRLEVAAGGDLQFNAARDSASGSSSSMDVTAGVSGSKTRGGVSAGFAMAQANSASSDAVAGSLIAGDNMSLTSGKNLKIEGASIAAGGNAVMAATGNVDLLAAASTSSSDSFSVDAKLGAGATKTTKTGTAQLGGALAKSDSRVETGSTIGVGGDLVVAAGGTATLQGTQADVGGGAAIEAVGGVVRKDAVSESSVSGFSASIYLQAGGKRGAKENAPQDQPTRARSNAATGEDVGLPAESRPRANALTHDTEPSFKLSTMDKAKAKAQTVFADGKQAFAAGKERKNSASVALPTAMPTFVDKTERSTKAVEIRQGPQAVAAHLPVAPPSGGVTPSSNVEAAKLNQSLASPLARYGTVAAIPDSVKRALLVKAGVSIPPGADLNALLVQAQRGSIR